MTRHTVYLSLGSNVGDRAAMLKRAIEALRETGVRVRRRSSLFESQPVDFPAQHWFLNGVVEAETELLPLQLLHALRRIEFRLGSRKLFARGPRRVDLDILLYGHATIRLPELGVPHPRMHLRRFVLAPLAEMVPSLSHPLWGATAAGLLTGTPDHSRVRHMMGSV
ncbi:MAG: 2-amino-4-hydroxy-6-hydroxymethyldihydropteridine diphosphokinase [Candidatus Acidiferrales bacterium]